MDIKSIKMEQKSKIKVSRLPDGQYEWAMPTHGRFTVTTKASMEGFMRRHKLEFYLSEGGCGEEEA